EADRQDGDPLAYRGERGAFHLNVCSIRANARAGQRGPGALPPWMATAARQTAFWPGSILRGALEVDSAVPVPGKRPFDMLPHQFRRSLSPPLQRSNHTLRSRRIPKRHRNIARPLLIPDAINRRPPQPRPELRLRPVEELRQPCRIQSMADLEVRM